MLEVPNSLSPDVAVLTEPRAIGRHAVRRARVAKQDVAVVLGCGPIGLAVVHMLKAGGVRTVVASDLSASRRALAAACGADVVVDPLDSSPYEAPGRRGFFRTVPDSVRAGVGAVERMQRLPIAWHHSWRIPENLGKTSPRRPVVFECVGAPGMIDGILTAASLYTRLVVVGVCSQRDHIRPVMAINEEIDLRFVVGYTPLEFRDTLHLLADGKVDASPLVTGAPSALRASTRPSRPCGSPSSTPRS